MDVEMMGEWLSQRWKCRVRLTQHAKDRMNERFIAFELIKELIETGKVKYKDENRLWIYKNFTNRKDNLICAAVVKSGMLTIKTVMHRWQLVEGGS